MIKEGLEKIVGQRRSGSTLSQYTSLKAAL